ncbi:MAG: DNA-binding response regulator [Epsilonproteobacteria bacterium]|nr:MAG: DNA-binding response regulator [Campylobacterota bacterium]
MKDISILVAEDDVALRNELVEYMSIFIDTIYEADDGKEALAMYKKHKPDILFADINMPHLNGLELIEEIREVDADIEIIIISAYTDTSYLLKAIELKLVSYIVKPIETMRLKNMLMKSIENVKLKAKSKKSIVELSDDCYWDSSQKQLYINENQIKLSSHELLFLECLIKAKNSTVSYEYIHNFVYDTTEFSKDAIISMVKRLRQKTSKNIVMASYKVGYRI